MKKRLIFDIDNTLIDWKNEYYDSMKRAMDKLNYPYDEKLFADLVIANDVYEFEYTTYNKTDMMDCLYKYSKVHLPDGFFDIWQEELGICSSKADVSLHQTLTYLQSKYDLVILSNWFAYAQTKRLEHAGILKYFSILYFPETFTLKPTKESFIKAIGEYDITECVMIGDSIRCDIDGAKSVGMDAIYYNKDGMAYENYPTVRNLSELMNIL